MTLRSILTVCLILGLGACRAPLARPTVAQAQQQVRATERAFAKTMADRDLARFATFLAEETIFFSGSTPLRGKAAVAADWARHFTAATAPFSWEPDEVEVLPSGDLALSSGPVRDPSGKVVARFTSIWRYEAPGTWRIIFDKGCPVCDSPGR
jgi:ketosteroid isomerase-like protein